MMTKQHRQSNVDNDRDDNNGRDGNGDGDGKGNGNDATATTDAKNVDDHDGVYLRMAIGQRLLDDNNGTTTICVNDDGNNGDGGDGKGNGYGNGDGDGGGNRDGNVDDATAVDGKDVNENDGGDSRTAIGR
jgi:hypothetical protein